MALEHPLKLLLSGADTKVVQDDIALGVFKLFGVDDLLLGSGHELRVFWVGVGVIVRLITEVVDDLLYRFLG